MTIALSQHRVENLQYMEDLMADHDVIILEEPPDPNFKQFLAGKMPTVKYIESLLNENPFPVFTTRLYNIIAKLSKQGKAILQVEPYLHALRKIKYGEPITDIDSQTVARVKHYEKLADGALIDFYIKSISADFNEIVNSVKRFAEIDAERFKLRDSLRARYIARILREINANKVYIEAGDMHLLLYHFLKEKLPNAKIKQVFLLREETLKITRKRRVYPPGDVLTITYMFGGHVNEKLRDLLAARSLVYTKLLTKEEILPDYRNLFPHLTEQIKLTQFVEHLSYSDCEEIYNQIRHLSREESLKIAKQYGLEDI